MKSRPSILVTNDDGITAPGILALVDVMREIGEVVVLAPDSPQSAMGHAITTSVPIRMEKVDLFKGIEAYQCTGTPVDCVKLAIDKVLDKLPDLCVSGINHGSNSSINIIYSGTMSAALEAAIIGINAVGFSLLDYKYDADFTAAKTYVKEVALNVLDSGLPKGTLLNVNVPALDQKHIKGMKICRQAEARWEENFDERVDPRGKKYYWLAGRFMSTDQGEDTDEWALQNGFVSVVPVQYDLTARHAIGFLTNSWKL
ncbi:MAG: 5'/3'-nucleotidase SurE [Bacteroidetes bacterium]|nr:5'/3'-nucleotidase SurE [Bacteroidota bacterium]